MTWRKQGSPCPRFLCLGRMACSEAAEEIPHWVVLLPYLQHSEGAVREVLGRVLGEVSTTSLGTEMLQFVDDSLPELRAAAARSLSHAEPGVAIDVLSELARDDMWFVRLRAIVSLEGFATTLRYPRY
jgi:HEAT repeat protein